MKTKTITRKATVSNRLPYPNFPYRVFYYAPGTGFDAGSLVYVGNHEFATLEEAQAAAKDWMK